ncbi:MAG: hypothetical protein ACR2PB_05620 [Desulfocapsaceae bacterium]
MNTIISIDDTDNPDSPGSGQLAEDLVQELIQCRLITEASGISRHQLLIHDLVPYTSHNSAMCFIVGTDQNKNSDLIPFCQEFLRLRSAQGSDPGLCVTDEHNAVGSELLIDFGLRAKRSVLSKQAAYQTAEQAGVHLSEHGGSGDGVIGALAGVGLRLSGYDGRIRGWKKTGEAGRTITIEKLCAVLDVPWAVDDTGTRLPDDGKVTISDERIKTVLHDHCAVIPLTRAEHGALDWATLSPAESKRY